MTNKKENKILRKTLSLTLAMLVSILGIPLAKPQQVSAAETSGAKYLSSITMDVTASSSWDTNYDTTLYATLTGSGYDSNYKTAETALQISGAKQLAAFARAVNVDGKTFEGKYVKLTAPIDLDGTNPTVTKKVDESDSSKFSISITGTASNVWVPIGTYDNHFKGTFDGGGYEVSNMTVLLNDANSGVCAGLFGYVDGGTIKNTGVTGNIYASSSVYAGGLVGFSSSSISNSYATGDVYASSSNAVYAGGLVGYNNSYGSVSNSYATGSVYASCPSRVSAGGLAGDNYGSITHSYATGDVYAYSYSNTCSAGGLAGCNNYGSVSNSYATGNIYAFSPNSSSNAVYAGGLVGSIYGSDSSISNSYATGNVYGSSSTFSVRAGGLVGDNTYGSISNSYATGNVYGSSSSVDVGGLAGSSYGSSITNSYYYSGATIDGGTGATISKDGTGLTMDKMTGTGTGRADNTMTGFTTDNWDFQADDGGIKYLPRLKNIDYNEERNPAPRFLVPTSSDFDFKAPTDLTYSGSAKKATVTAKSGVDGMGEITIKYYKNGVEISPIDVGTYIVKIDVDEGGNYEARTGISADDWTFTIAKADPIIKSTSVTTAYAPSLTLAKVPYPSATGNTLGLWSWSDPSTSISTVGTYEFEAKFTPTDSENFNEVTKSISVTINKADPTLNSISTSTTYVPGLTLKNVPYPSTEGNTAGSWSWVSPSTSVSTVGTYKFQAKYTPSDTTNYNSVTKYVTVIVTKGDPTLNSISTSATYASGLTLKNVPYPSTEGNTAGSWSWLKPSSSISAVGEYYFDAKFTPTSSNFNEVTKSILVTVNKADPTISSTSTTATYAPGLTLKNVLLPSSTSGTWSWLNPSASISTAGTHYFEAKFTPTDSKNFNEVTKSFLVTVSKATPKASDFKFSPPSNLEHSADYKVATVIPKSDIEGAGNPTVKYFTKINGELIPLQSSSMPMDIGTYYVGIDVSAGANYNAIDGLNSDDWTFSIVPTGNHTYRINDGLWVYMVRQPE